MTEHEPKPESPAKSNEGPWSFLIGLAMAICIPVLLVFALIPTKVEVLFFPLAFIGLSQLVYIIPLIIYFHRNGKRRTIQGLIIGAAVVFLLNASCFGLVMTMSW